MREKKNCPGCGAVIYYDGLCWRCKEKRRYDAIVALSDGEVDEKIVGIVRNLNALDADNCDWSSGEDALEDFEMLLAYREIGTAPISGAAFSKGVYRPETVYRDAGPDVRDGLLRELASLPRQP